MMVCQKPVLLFVHRQAGSDGASFGAEEEDLRVEAGRQPGCGAEGASLAGTCLASGQGAEEELGPPERVGTLGS